MPPIRSKSHEEKDIICLVHSASLETWTLFWGSELMNMSLPSVSSVTAIELLHLCIKFVSLTKTFVFQAQWSIHLIVPSWMSHRHLKFDMSKLNSRILHPLPTSFSSRTPELNACNHYPSSCSNQRAWSHHLQTHLTHSPNQSFTKSTYFTLIYLLALSTSLHFLC